jgi:UDP-N-acetylmuramoyl-L-alanyl-D-glutamate--2,6-diaminopimelate ligase
VGTVGYFIGSGHYQASHTTPGAVALQALLGEMVKARLDTAIVEVSSHALALERVGGCDFDIVVFTNLTQDHLDFHKDMEDYFLAKLRLFTEFVGGEGKRFPKRAIINTDDEKGRRIVETSPIPVWTYSIRTPSDIRAQDIQVSQEGTRFTAQTPMGTLEIRSRLIGEHNVYNLLAAIGVGLEMGTTPQTIESAFQFVNNVPGRFERVDQGQSFTVFVDYAHTEDALIRLLAAAQSIRRNRIITVFGCGGDRDPGKRPKMGQAAVKGSDLVMLTSDNPRTEKPLSIIKDIERGILELPLSERSEYQVIPDRAQAIEKAIKEARTDDIVLIAGKGHEDYQIIGKTRLNFDDREMAKQAILQYQGT